MAVLSLLRSFLGAGFHRMAVNYGVGHDASRLVTKNHAW